MNQHVCTLPYVIYLLKIISGLLYMSLYKMPVEVREQLDHIQRNFLWDGTNDKRKLHQIKWSEVVKAKALGGMVLGCFTLKNHDLLAKWWWRFGVETEALWRRRIIIVSKFGKGKRRWVPSRVPRYRRFGCWGVISCLEDVSVSCGEPF